MEGQMELLFNTFNGLMLEVSESLQEPTEPFMM